MGFSILDKTKYVQCLNANRTGVKLPLGISQRGGAQTLQTPAHIARHSAHTDARLALFSDSTQSATEALDLFEGQARARA